MTIQGQDGEESPQQLSMSRKERAGTFYVKEGINSSAMVVYDYNKVSSWAWVGAGRSD